jgi:UDP-N-acetylmuramate--alanine ligase
VLEGVRHVHFVGVGGSGMSGIAELLVNLGYNVSGSDVQQSEVTGRLARLGVRVYTGHEASQVGDAEVVVTSSAVPVTNPEIVEAARRDIPTIPRAEMLAQLMRLKSGIAVAGAHGKTTTTSMIAFALEQAGLDPTAVIGGRLGGFGSNARLGRGDWMVAEADESDRSFLRLAPRLAVITNIDDEHLEAYRSFDHLLESFVEFANNVPKNGATVLCVADEHARAILPRIECRVVTYGLDVDAEISGHDVVLDGLHSSCVVRRRQIESRGGRVVDLDVGRLSLAVPGRHNLLNALAAIAVCSEVGVSFETVAKALKSFRGVDRRFQVLGEDRGVMVVDDYGHHPTEIAAVVAAARVQRPGRILVVFQPHRYSRTRQQIDAFGPALAEADAVVLTDIYAAGEAPIAGVTVDALADAIQTTGPAVVEVVPALADVPSRVADMARTGDLVVMLGAGSIGAWGMRVLDALRARE